MHLNNTQPNTTNNLKRGDGKDPEDEVKEKNNMQQDIVSNINKRNYLPKRYQLHHDIRYNITDLHNTNPNHLRCSCNNNENKDYHKDNTKMNDYKKKDSKST